jgi:hypothetical protein
MLKRPTVSLYSRRSYCTHLFVVVLILGGWAGLSFGQLLAFPGAEGEGMYVSGGRGGDVYHVTNLNDIGAGSLRYGLDNAPAGGRTIVFDVSGMITLSTYVGVNRSNITIAGQTAPGMGICIRDYGMGIGADNVIVRHMRCRPGDAQKGPGKFTEDALGISASHVIIDHCSASWGIDENLSFNTSSGHDVTVQYCTISEGLDQTGLYHGQWEPNYYPGGSKHHSNGSLIKPMTGNALVTYHHNLWSQNNNRTPALGTYHPDQILKADIRNNVIYNNNRHGYGSEESNYIEFNYVGNYIIAGPETYSTWMERAFDANATNHFRIYQSGNKVDSNLDTVRDGTDTGWAMFSGSWTALGSPVSMRPVTTQTVDEAYELVLNTAGAFFWNRDSVDARLISNVRNMTGEVIDSQSEVGGYPTIPAVSRSADWDTDMDGMPNFWELVYGTNPNVADNNGDMNSDGYTNLEDYLAYAAVPEPATLSLLIAGIAGLLCHRGSSRRVGQIMR